MLLLQIVFLGTRIFNHLVAIIAGLALVKLLKHRSIYFALKELQIRSDFASMA